MVYNKDMGKWLVFIVILAGISFLTATFLIQPKFVEVEHKQLADVKPEQIEKDQIKIILAGDIMLNRGIEYMVEKYGGGDFKFPFLKIAEEFQKADIVFGNLEGPISDKGVKVGSIYSFRNDPQVIEGLKFAGFNVISLANNHALDYGRQALEDTFLRLKEADINYVGAGFNEFKAYSPVIKEVKSVKIAFLAYTNLGPETWQAQGQNSGITWLNEKLFDKAGQQIEDAKENSDILIVSLHAGEEYQTEPTQFQIDFAKMAIDAGADLVVGHHPHIIQPTGTEGNNWIFYSLGNFIFDQSFSEETMKGKIIELLIEKNKINEINQREVKINEFYQPEIK